MRRQPRSTLFPYTTLFRSGQRVALVAPTVPADVGVDVFGVEANGSQRSEEHTSELQSQPNLVCRLLLEKKTTDIFSIVPVPYTNPAFNPLLLCAHELRSRE